MTALLMASYALLEAASKCDLTTGHDLPRRCREMSLIVGPMRRTGGLGGRLDSPDRAAPASAMAWNGKEGRGNSTEYVRDGRQLVAAHTHNKKVKAKILGT